jgi:Ca2+-binding EF-hand superfamily protein
MRSVCALGLGLAVLVASGSAPAQENTAKAKPSPSVTIIVIEPQPGPGGAPIAPHVLTGWTLVPPGGIPSAVTPAKVNAPAPAPDGPLSGVFQAMDTNKDGKISKAEFKGPGEIFASVDTNRDGAITPPEAIRYLAFVGLVSLQEKAVAFRTMDADKDGKVSAAEFKGPKERFARLDVNHDGVITREETIQALDGRVRLMRRVAHLRAMDANHDGLISATEFKGPKPAFAKLDIDHDGNISRSELDRLFRPESARHVVAPAQTVIATAKAPAVATTKTVAQVPVKVATQATTPAALGVRARRILALDSNKDGKVCQAEFMAGREKRFGNLDKNKDGYLTPAEISKAVETRRVKTSQSKVVTANQTTKFAAPQPAKATRVTNPKEVSPAVSPPAIATRVMALDSNHDGKVSKAE